MKGSLVLAASVLTLVAPPASSQAAVSRLSISDVRVVEGNAGTKRAVLSVRRSGPARRKAGLRYTTADGTAKAGSDYSRKSGKLSFRRGQKRKTVVISIRGDTLDEPNEAFFVRISRPKGGRVGRSRARGTIVDDDAPLGLPPLGGGPTGGGGGGGGGGGATPQVVRFIAVGDTGKGNTGQYDVANAMQAKCAASGCDYIVGLGDNIYDAGVDSVNDPQFQEKFETPYQNIDLPFWMLLGHHDYGDAGTEPAKGEYQVDYTAQSTKWKMPDNYYRRTDKHVEFFTLDTTPIYTPGIFGNPTDQQTNVPAWITGSSATWKIALGHHTYRSNGPHGNAGNYDGLSSIPQAGKTVKDFMEAHVCGKADVYFSAHDHSLQWPSATCSGTELIVSGAGAATTDLPGSNAYHFQSLELGFVYVVIQDRQLTAEFVDVDGATLFTRTISK